MTKEETRIKMLDLYLTLRLGKKWLDENKEDDPENLNKNIFKLKVLKRLNSLSEELNKLTEENKAILDEPETQEAAKTLVTKEHLKELADKLFTFKDFDPFNPIENFVNYFLNE